MKGGRDGVELCEVRWTLWCGVNESVVMECGGMVD